MHPCLNSHHKREEEESKRGKVISQNYEVFVRRINEVFSPSNKEISVVLLLV
jgi:hypothetical protein